MSGGSHEMPRALVAGGGSGGHVFPGLAIAAELCERGWEVSWAGTERGMEARLVGERRIDFHALPARAVLGRGLAAKIGAAFALAGGAWRARALVRRLGARVVVGTGGYASVPAVVGARLASRPVLLVEPNAAAGAANRFLSRFAAGAAVAYDVTSRELACPATVTGVPVRDAFFDVGEAEASGPLRLLVVGGSQGAEALNDTLPRALATLLSSRRPAGLGGLVVVHQAGAAKVDAARRVYAEAGLGSEVDVQVVPFLDDMPAAVAQAHLVVSRAGAITLAELCAAGRPSVLVPLTLAGGHQVTNARRLEDAGAARVLEPGAGADELAAILAELAADRGRLAEMGRAARRLAHRGAAAAIAELAVGLGGKEAG